MEHHDVTSSSISRIGYEDGTLEVVFANGGHYSYEGVKPEEFEALRTAKSIGGHFAANIRGKFPHARVEVKPDAAAGQAEEV